MTEQDGEMVNDGIDDVKDPTDPVDPIDPDTLGTTFSEFDNGFTSEFGKDGTGRLAVVA